MNRKQFLLIIIVGLVVGGYGLSVYKREKAAFQTFDAQSGKKLIPDFPLNDIAQLRIKQAGGEVNLVKSENGWNIKERHNYPANFGELSELLRKIWELKTVQDVKVGASQLGRLELSDPQKGGTNSGTLLEFKDKSGANLKTLLLGKKHSRESQTPSPFGGGGGDFAVGRYVMIPDGAAKVWLISDPLASVEPKPEQWLDKDFFKVEKLKSVAVNHPGGTNSWALARETDGGELKLLEAKEGEKADSGKASGAGYALSSPSFTDIVAPDAKPEETGLDAPITAKLETFEGFTYNVKIGKASADNYHFQVAVEGNFKNEREPGKDEKPEDKEKLDKEFKEKTAKLEEKLKAEKAYGKWTYLVAKWTIEPLLKERKDLFADKKEDKPADAADAHPPEIPADLLKQFNPVPSP